MPVLADQVITSDLSARNFAAFDAFPGVVAVARDASYRQLWCNNRWAKLHGRSVDDLRGSLLQDVVPSNVACERMRAKAPVIERRETVLFRLLWRGIHYVARSSPLDPATFSCTGVFTIMMPAPTADDTGEIQAIPVLAEPTFGDLAALTPRELEVLYFAARGLQKPEIAAKIYRAVKTIDHHIASIHEKLGIHTRGELSSWAAARGFLAFTPEQWTSFVAKKQSHNHETTSGYFESQVLKLV